MSDTTKVLHKTKDEIYLNQKKRIENGKKVKYKDGKEYLVSPGYTTVLVSVLKAYLKGFGMKALSEQV